MFKHFFIYRIVVVVLILICTTSLSIAQAEGEVRKTYIYDGPNFNGPYYSSDGMFTNEQQLIANLDTETKVFGSLYVLDTSLQTMIGNILLIFDYLIDVIPQLFVGIALLLYTISIGFGVIQLIYKRDKFGALVKIMTLLMTIVLAGVVYNTRQHLFKLVYEVTTQIPDIISDSIQTQFSTAFKNELEGLENSIFDADNIELKDSRGDSDFRTAERVSFGYRYPTSYDYRFGVASFNIASRSKLLKDAMNFTPKWFGTRLKKPIGFFEGLFISFILFVGYLLIVVIKNIAGLMIMLRLLVVFMCTPFYGYTTMVERTLRLNLASVLHWVGYLIMLGVSSAIFLSGLEVSLSPLITIGFSGTSNFNWMYFLGAAILSFIILAYSYKFSDFLSALVLGSGNNRQLTTIASPTSKNINSENKDLDQSIGKNAGKAMGAALGGAAGAQIVSQPAGRQGMSGGLGTMMPNFANATISGNGEDSVMFSRADKQSFKEINSEGEVIGEGEHYVVAQGNSGYRSPYGGANRMFNRNSANNGVDGDGGSAAIDSAGSPAMHSNISPNATADAPQPSRLERVKQAVGKVKTGVAQATHTGKSIVDAPLKFVSAVTGGPKDKEGNLYHDSFFKPIDSGYRRYEKGEDQFSKFDFSKLKEKNKRNDSVKTSVPPNNLTRNDDFRSNVFPNSRKKNTDLLTLSEKSQAYLEYKKTYYLPMTDNPTHTTGDASGTFKNTDEEKS